MLSDTGVEDSKFMQKVTKKMKYDIVCSSTLNRAIETALLMFPNDTVHVVPYAKEIKRTKDSTCQSIASKKALFKKTYPNDYKRINFKFMDDENKNKWSFSKCIKFLKDTFGDKKVAIVSHSLYMVKYLNVPMKPFPFNNCVYTYENGNTVMYHRGRNAHRHQTLKVKRCKSVK
jgi:broad specificity phosphatase PhoE